MGREKAQVVVPRAVPMRRPGSDCSVVVMKRGNARGAKGAGHSRRDRKVNGQPEEPGSRRKAAAFRGWHEPDESRGLSPVVCPVNAGMFSREQTCRGRSQSPVVWIAEEMETEPSKPIDKTSPGEVTSHRAVTKVNALWPRK